MSELKFDKMEVNTQQAEDYLEANKDLLNSIVKGEVYRLSEMQQKGHNLLDALANLIGKNAELFAQLEALKRGLPKDEVKKYDIKLIIQYLKLRKYGKEERLQSKLEFVKIVMSKDDPLAKLGNLIRIFDCDLFGVIYCDKATLPVCLLFIQLCRQAGYINVELALNTKTQTVDQSHVKEVSKWACTGVITENSDLDSAIDTFLASTTKYPWKLRRLYIQESFYERFMKALTWKCDLQRTSTDDVSVNTLCSEVRVYDEKVFFFDYTGTFNQIEETRQVIFVEAYRTVKELIGVIKKNEPFCLSLWSSDVCESNEIAFGVNVPIVWVNDYGLFDGPPNSSLAFYRYKDYFENNWFVLESEVGDFQNNYELWSKLTIEDRIKKIENALKKCTIDDKIESILTFIYNLKSNKFVEIEKNRLCVGINSPVGIIYWVVEGAIDIFKRLLVSVVYGNGVIWDRTINFTAENTEYVLKLIKMFEKEKLPFKKVSFVPFTQDKTKKYLKAPEAITGYRTRVVYTSFGTVFAN